MFPPKNEKFSWDNYKNCFSLLGYKLWDIQQNKFTDISAQLKSREDNSTTLLTGTADYFVTLPSVTEHILLENVLCVIEVQSNNNK